MAGSIVETSGSGTMRGGKQVFVTLPTNGMGKEKGGLGWQWRVSWSEAEVAKKTAQGRVCLLR